MWIAAIFLMGVPFCAIAQNVITTIAGGPRLFPPTGIPATSTAVTPVHVAARRDGTVFISDSLGGVVLQVTSSGVLTVFAGNGILGYSGDGGPATSASLGFPGALAFDPSGALLIADSSRIRKVTTAGIISTVAIVSGAGGVGAMAVDSAGNIFVTANNRVMRISGTTVTAVAGNGTTGFGGDGGPALNAGLNLFRAGLAVDAQGNLYISDPGNQRIRRVDPAGMISTFAGNGMFGSSGDGGPATQASLGFPEGLALDTDGGLIIADTVNSRVRRVSPAGIITTVAGNGNNVYQTDGVQATTTAVACVAVAVDRDGNIFVADEENFRLRRVDRATGIVSTFAGTGNGADPGDGAAAINGGLAQPSGVAADAAGNLYIADTRNNRIRRVDPKGVITTVAGTGARGWAGDGGPGTSAVVEFPNGIAVSPSGDLYFTDATHVRKLTAGGTISTFAGALDGSSGFSGDNGPATSAKLYGPTGLAFDSGGNLFIADYVNCRVRRVTPRGVISTVAGNGTCDFGGDGGPAIAASLKYPLAVAVDGAGVLYIADSGNNRIRKVGTDGIISTIAGNGTVGVTGDNGPASAATLSDPCGVALDKAGNLFVSGCLFPSVRRIGTNGVITTVAGGARGFSGDGGPATAAGLQLGGYSLVAVDAAGNLIIPDSENNRIRAVLASAPSATVSPAQLSFSGTSGGVVPPAQRVTVQTAVAAMPFTARAVVSGSTNWLSVSPSAGYTPTAIAVTASPSQLQPGTYQGTVEIRVTGGDPAVLSVKVTLTVGASLPARLSVDSPRLTFITSPGGSAATGVIAVNNVGGGVLSFSAVPVTDSGAGFLTLTSPSSTATPSAPGAVLVTAAPGSLGPGVYTSHVAISSPTSGEKASVPVTMVVRNAQSKILLSYSGISFQAVAGATAPPAQTIAVLNRAQGTLTWSASAKVLTGGTAWLKVGQSSGTVARPLLDAAPIDVSVDAANLATGTYYGQVVVSSGNSDQQSVTVVLRVMDAGGAAPLVQPTGLMFTARSGLAPSSQNLSVRATGAAPLAFNSAQLTVDGANWLQYVPPNANVLRTQSQRITVQPASLGAGVYDGSITLLFDDGSIDVIRVKTVVAPGSCTATRLVMLPTNVEQFFAASLYLPMGIQVQIVDDCGVALTADRGASVAMNFSNGDPTVALIPVGGGVWATTWQPGRAAAGPVYINVAATMPASGKAPLTGSMDLQADLAGTADLPVSFAMLNAASFALNAPVAPGALVSLFGANLAEGIAAASNLPLPATLGNTRVALGGIALPLTYASGGQVNAQVPTDLATGTELPLTVTRGNAISVPQQIVIANAAPGVFTRDQSGTGAGLIVNGATNAVFDADHPAHAGDSVVIYCTGMGAVTPQPPSGDGAAGAAPVNAPVTLTIGGRTAQVLYAGLTPGFPGLYQINATVPDGVAAGPAAVVASVGGQVGVAVTLAVQ